MSAGTGAGTADSGEGTTVTTLLSLLATTLQSTPGTLYLSGGAIKGSMGSSSSSSGAGIGGMGGGGTVGASQCDAAAILAMFAVSGGLIDEDVASGNVGTAALSPVANAVLTVVAPVAALLDRLVGAALGGSGGSGGGGSAEGTRVASVHATDASSAAPAPQHTQHTAVAPTHQPTPAVPAAAAAAAVDAAKSQPAPTGSSPAAVAAEWFRRFANFPFDADPSFQAGIGSVLAKGPWSGWVVSSSTSASFFFFLCLFRCNTQQHAHATTRSPALSPALSPSPSHARTLFLHLHLHPTRPSLCCIQPRLR
jgi:hypothetical protein